MKHPPDANKMACRHEPKHPIAVLYHVCKHCGIPIDWKPCVACDGMGVPWCQTSRCCVCRGTGVDHWEAVP